MWSLRVLNGPQAGQIFNLKQGKNLVGRSSSSDIKLMAQGVSKEHCEIHVVKDKVTLIDLNSSNGTFVNSVRIQNATVRIGEKFSIYNIFLDIIPTPQIKVNTAIVNQNNSNVLAVNQMSQPNADAPYFQQAAHQLQPQFNQMPQPHMMGQMNPQSHMQAHLTAVKNENQKSEFDLKEKIQDYFDRVVLPSVYKLAQTFELKYVLAGFVFIYIFAVTLLSLFPMVSITKDSIQGEAKKRALSLARALAETNKRAISENLGASLNTFSIEKEEGVKEALIVNRNDGTVMAPASKSGRTLDIPFINEAIRSSREKVKNIDFSTIGASFPIDKYDIEKQEATSVAYAIVIYDINTLAFDEGIVISLFMQNLIIATLVGLLLFFFLYKLIEFPVLSLNKQLDQAMREKNEHIENTFLFPPLQALTGNISSLMTRYLNGDHQANKSQNKDFEASMLIQHFRDPAFAITGEKKIINLNTNFESLCQNSHDNIMSQGLSAIVDSALKQNIEILMGQSSQVPTQIHQAELDMGRGIIIIRCHAIMESSQVSYYLFTIIPKKEET